MHWQVLERLGVRNHRGVVSGVCHRTNVDRPGGEELPSINPATGETLGVVRLAGPADYEAVVQAAQEAFLRWRMNPAPARGEVVRRLGLALRKHKEDLGLLVSLETGKIQIGRAHV